MRFPVLCRILLPYQIMFPVRPLQMGLWLDLAQVTGLGYKGTHNDGETEFDTTLA